MGRDPSLSQPSHPSAASTGWARGPRPEETGAGLPTPSISSGAGTTRHWPGASQAARWRGGGSLPRTAGKMDAQNECGLPADPQRRAEPGRPGSLLSPGLASSRRRAAPASPEGALRGDPSEAEGETPAGPLQTQTAHRNGDRTRHRRGTAQLTHAPEQACHTGPMNKVYRDVAAKTKASISIEASVCSDRDVLNTQGWNKRVIVHIE